MGQTNKVITPLKDVTLWRGKSHKHGIFGRLFFSYIADNDSKTICFWECMSLECPDYKNTPYKSCIPVGRYECAWIESPSKGWRYTLRSVYDRTHILIHPGNWAAGKDAPDGLRTDSYGCILLGKSRERIDGQPGVTNSKDTVEEFEELLGGEPFTLDIKEYPKDLFLPVEYQ